MVNGEFAIGGDESGVGATREPMSGPNVRDGWKADLAHIDAMVAAVQSRLNPALVRAWLEARSVVRDLPAPVEDYGGFRVDTRDTAEVARWVFPAVGPGLTELGHRIARPGYLIKLCGSMEALCGALPKRWRPHASGYFMVCAGPSRHWPLPAGYVGEVDREGARSTARAIALDGTPAAFGYAAETSGVFIYDRITTQPRHRRRGLARGLMALLRTTKRCADAPEVLVATEDGRKLYEA